MGDPVTSRKPLEGIRVIELSAWVMGPTAGMMLGDLGADVIKIETPGEGDPSRGSISAYGFELTKQTPMGTTNLTFDAVNRNKRGMTLNLKSEQGRQILYRLIEKSDIFLQNIRPGHAERIGCGYAELLKYNPKLIYASGSGGGKFGPERLAPLQDNSGSAWAGAWYLADSSAPPTYLIGALGDNIAGTLLVCGILIALRVRDLTGMGQEVDSSLLGGLIWLQNWRIACTAASGKQFIRFDRTNTDNPLMNVYKCQDDKWLSLGCFQPTKYWQDLCDVLGLDGLKNDPRFADFYKIRENRREIITILDKAFATKPREYWIKMLRNTPADIVCTPVQNHLDLLDDPQVLANEFIADFEHPILGPIKTTGRPLQFSHSEYAERTPAPQCGQHTEEILLELCGYDWDQIGKLRDEGVI